MAYDWIQLFPAHAPSARFGYGLAYDSAREQLVLFGGGTSSADPASTETWTWDGSDWTHLSPVTTPTPHQDFNMCFDAANSEIVAFGGRDENSDFGGVQNETWTWNGTDWTQNFPAHAPSARVDPAIGFDSSSGYVILFGGRQADFTIMNDTWKWDGTDWTELFPADPAPLGGASGRLLSGIARSPGNGGEALLFGGGDAGSGTKYDDTFIWNGTDWVHQSPSHKPSPRWIRQQLVSWRDSKILLFGGAFSPNFSIYEDTWTWAGTDWTLESPAHRPSPHRSSVQMAYDVLRDQVMLFGGSGPEFGVHDLGDTWIYADTGPFTLHLER